jgi:hypothetical protein
MCIVAFAFGGGMAAGLAFAEMLYRDGTNFGPEINARNAAAGIKRRGIFS